MGLFNIGEIASDLRNKSLKTQELDMQYHVIAYLTLAFYNK